MIRTYKIFTINREKLEQASKRDKFGYQVEWDREMSDFVSFINGLAKKCKKYNITPWSSNDGNEHGFCVWYWA